MKKLLFAAAVCAVAAYAAYRSIPEYDYEFGLDDYDPIAHWRRWVP